MFAAGIVTFREALEAALVVGIVLSFLAKTKQTSFNKFVWQGVVGGIAASVVIAVLLELFFGGLTGKTEEIFEGILMFVTAGFLTWMILWVHRQKEIAENIRKKVSMHISKNYGLGIAVLVSTAVMREGTETVFYLKALSISGAQNQLLGAFLGLAIAVLIGVAIFKYAMRFSLSVIFNVTTVFLLLFAAGLVGHGVHEFQEAGLLPIYSFDPIFNISHILDNNSFFGSLLRILFGYTSKPTLLELVSYGTYIGVMLWIERYTSNLIHKKAAR